MAGKKLLVADDSLTIQKVIRLALSNEGYEIQAISDGAEAIEHIATFKPDVVLIDVSLPSRTAFEIKRESNTMEESRNIKYILMSSAFEKIDETQANEVYFDGRLTKPFDPTHLRQVLNEVLVAPAPPKTFPKQTAPSQMPPLPLDFASEPKISLKPPTVELQAPAFKPQEDELWGKYIEPETTEALEIQLHSPSERDEIKHLTESTIRMSGLAEVADLKVDEFEWKVNEPSLKPPTSFADIEESPFQSQSEARSDQPSKDHKASSSKGPSTPVKSSNDSDERFELEFKPQPNLQNSLEIEELVRKQVQETLQRMAAELLPEVAERVIKAEINRLLNEKF